VRTRVILLTIAAVVLAVAGGCGIAADGEFRPIGQNDLQESGLLDTTTTSTTTTSTTTTIARTTVVETTSTTVAETTTTAVATEPVTLYFIAGSQLVGVTQALPRPATAQQVLFALAAGPPEGDAGIGLRTALPSDAIVSVEIRRGTAYVELSPSVIALPSEVPLAIAQIVMSLKLAGIGQVVFTTGGGVSIPVPRGDGSLTEAGTAVTFDDYEDLVAR
jgi:Sporulation and spore germination